MVTDGTVGTAVVPLIWSSEGPAKKRGVDSADQDHYCLSGMVAPWKGAWVGWLEALIFAKDVIPWLC